MSIDWVSFSKLEPDRAWIKLRDGYVLCACVLARHSFLILYPTSRARNWHLSNNQSPAALRCLDRLSSTPSVIPPQAMSAGKESRSTRNSSYPTQIKPAAEQPTRFYKQASKN